MPCRESQAKPGTCLWCLCKSGESRPELVPSSDWRAADDELVKALTEEMQRAARLASNPPSGDRVAATIDWLQRRSSR